MYTKNKIVIAKEDRINNPAAVSKLYSSDSIIFILLLLMTVIMMHKDNSKIHTDKQKTYCKTEKHRIIPLNHPPSPLTLPVSIIYII